MKKETALVIGLGEIGNVVFDLLEESNFITYGYDIKNKNLNKNNKKFMITENNTSDSSKNLRKNGVDYLHICFPYFDEKFIAQVKGYLDEFHPKLCIIHSTVKVGATNEINKAHSNRMNIVHSPVQGNHKNMYEHIKNKFIKYVGSNSKKHAELACQHLTNIGIEQVKWIGSPETTELAKLIETSWYGVNIAFMQDIERMCKHFKINFTDVMGMSFDSYFDEKHLYKRPKMFPGLIEGHCVCENAKILDSQYSSDFIRASLRSNEQKFREVNPIKKVTTRSN